MIDRLDELLEKEESYAVPDEETDTLYLWLDKDSNRVVQDEVVPSTWASLFDYREEAEEFLEIYRNKYAIESVESYELYEVEVKPLGSGDDVLG